MKRIDWQLMKAVMLTTIIALVGYLFLSLIAQRYIAEASSSTLGVIFEAPLLVIATIQSYWWFGYILLVSLLLLKWAIKR